MKIQVKAFSIAAAAMALVGGTAGCTGGGPTELRKEPVMEVIPDTMEIQPALQPQDEDPHNNGQAASRLPPVGTVPVGYTPYKYKGNPQAAAANLKNPLAGQMTPEILAQGQKHYETYCLVCHGAKGGGDGPVAVKMALKPPAITTEKIRTMNDAGIYHIITDGQGVMSSYAYQLVDERDRWAIVNYIRSLQQLTKAQ